MKKVLIVLLIFIIILPMIAKGAEDIAPQTVKKVDQIKQTAIELFNEGKYNKAIQLFEEILSINPLEKTASRYLLLAKQQIVEPLCRQAADAYLESNYTKAIENWESILKINPDDRRVTELIESTKNLVQDSAIEVMYDLVNKLLKEEKYAMAVNELEKILLMTPGDQQAKELLASANKALIDKEIKDRYEKADTYMKQKKYNLAIEEWREILKIDERQEAATRLIASTTRIFMDTLYSSAEKSFREGDYLTSLEQYNRILMDNPGDQYTKKITSKLNDVFKIIPKIEKQGPTWDMLKIGLGHYIALDGNPKAALAAVWYAIQLDPKNNLAIAARDFLENKFSAVVRTTEYPVKDMNVIEQYLFAALNNIYVGRYDLAIQECSLVLELQPLNILALKRLGSAYYAMKNSEKARESWEKALKLSPDDNELKRFLKELQ